MSWEFVKLKSVALIHNGYAFKSKEYVGSGMRVIRITNVQKGIIVDDNPRFIAVSRAEDFIKFHLYAGDILISLTGNVGRVGALKKEHEPALLNQRVGAIRVNSGCIHQQFLYLFLNSDQFEIDAIKNAKGVAQLNLSTKWVEEYKIPLPPLDDQVRIVSLLSRAKALIAARKNNLRLLDEFLKSTFMEMFGDPIKNEKGFPIRVLSELYFDPKNGTKCGPFGSALKKEEYVDTGIPVWNMDNISTNGRMQSQVNLWVTEEKYEELKGYSTINGDVIISRAGTVGKMCVLNTLYPKSIISTNLIRVRFGKKLLPLYFVSLMTHCKGRVGKLRTGGDGAFTHMNTGILDKLQFPYPPIELQKQYATIVEKVEALKNNYQQNLTELENFYGTLSQKAFKGELDLSRIPVKPIEKTTKPEIELSDKAAPQEQAAMQAEFASSDAPMSFPASRECTLRNLFDSYLHKVGDTSFAFDDLWQHINSNLLDHILEPEEALGVEDYDKVKSWLFETLDNKGKGLHQLFDEEKEKRHIVLKAMA